MTQQDRIDLGNQIMMTAVCYGVEIERSRLTLILNYWASTEVAPPTIIVAYKRFMKESKFNKFPSPAEIMSIINPSADPHDLGVITASRVVKAVSKFGYNNQAEAFEYIGPAGVDAVRRFGGWLYICENLGVTIDITTFQAQVREIIKSEIKLNQIGGYEKAIAYEEKKQIEENQKKMSEVLAIAMKKKEDSF